MLHRAGVLGELRGAQVAHFLDARHGARINVRTVFLIAEHGEPFLERELEPVAAGDAVAGPVMEVLVRDDPVDVEVIDIRRGVGARQHVLGVEDVEALVLHCPRVEIAHRHDVVLVEVQLEAEARLVPADRALQAIHRPARLVELAGLDVHVKLLLLARARDDRIGDVLEIRGDHREEIGGLGERVVEARPVAARDFVARAGDVAVRQQHRIALLVGVDGRRIGGHHVRSIDEPGDAPEALGLALRDEAVLRRVEAFELGVLLRHDAAHRFQREAIGHVVDGQALRRDLVAGAAPVDR